MTRDQIVKHFGGVQKAADGLGVSRQTIYLWDGGIPHRSQQLIEALTGGKLKADKKKGAR